jgi:hypothetical protein
MSGIIGTSKVKTGVVGYTPETSHAWINFNGTGTVAIRTSFNVSSLTDNGTGDYTITFAVALNKTNPCVASSFQSVGNDGDSTSFPNHLQTATSSRLEMYRGSSISDSAGIYIVYFGDA